MNKKIKINIKKKKHYLQSILHHQFQLDYISCKYIGTYLFDILLQEHLLHGHRNRYSQYASEAKQQTSK